jgi:hypothetical protein
MPAADVAGWVRDWRGLFALAAAPVVPHVTADDLAAGARTQSGE